jgi:AsmA protein
MKKSFKYLLWSVFAVVLLVSAAVAYLLLAFDPNAYKPQIIQAVRDNTQRTLRLDGDIRLAFFPRLEARLGRVSLSEFQSDEEFAAVSDAAVSIAVWPLLSKHLVVDRVKVDGVRVRLIKYADGSSNLDDLLRSGDAATQREVQAPQSAPVAFNVAGVQVENCEVHFEDRMAQNTVSVTALSLKTGRVANATPTPVSLSAHIQSSQPQMDVAVRLATTVNFDFERNRYSLQGADGVVEGRALDISDLMLKLAGDVKADFGVRSYELSGFVLEARGKKAGDSFDLKLSAPTFALAQENFSGESLVLKAGMDGAGGKLNTVLKVPAFKGNMEKFSLQGLALEAGLKQPARVIDARLDAVLIGSLKTLQFNLKDMNLAVKASGDKLPGKVVESALKGSVQADLERQSVQANFSGGLLQSQIKAKAAINNFRKPVIRYDLEIDKFDVDPYLPPSAPKSTKAAKQEAEQPFDLSFLKPLDVSGSLRVGTLKAANVKLSKLRIDVKAREGIAVVEPLSAALYQGRMEGRLRVDANESAFSLTQNLSGVEIVPLMKDAASLELAEGKGNISVDVTTRGNTVSALKRALNGAVSVNLADGAIRGVNLAKLVQGIQNLNKDSKAETMGINKNEKTLFSEFRAGFRIKDGVARNDDLAVKSTVLRLSGSGEIDIGQDRMDYNAKVILAKTDQGRTGTLPVRVYGPFDDVRLKVDYAALFADVARQRLNEEKAALKQKLDAEKAATRQKLEDKVKQKLKGLIKQ